MESKYNNFGWKKMNSKELCAKCLPFYLNLKLIHRCLEKNGSDYKKITSN